MTVYQQSQTIQEIRAKHPFPWKEQRMMNFVRMIDANNAEVVLFEITALASLVTNSMAAKAAETEKETTA